MEKIPYWCEDTLQGLSYWIGYKRSFFRHQPYSEGALVAEACNLIQSKLSKSEHLFCEVGYRYLLPPSSEAIKGKNYTRADLVITTSDVSSINKNIRSKTKAIIEVKRAKAGAGLINKDLKRLHDCLSQNDDIRAFLIIVSEKHLPNRFVTEAGVAVNGKKKIPGSEGFHRVRRVCKAAGSFTRRKSVHYSCLIELFC